MKLNFLVAGFSKCGTTTLCSMLMSHPQLFIPPRFKEPRFFVDDNYVRKWQWFIDLFHEAAADMLLGEGTVSYSEYSFAKDCCRRIKEVFPDIKIILIARDPIDRLESSFREMHSSGPDWGLDCSFDIHDALLDLPNMLDDTRYFEILSIYHDFFQKEQVLVLFQEELKSNPRQLMEQCFDFLGVDQRPLASLENKQLNRANEKFYDVQQLRDLRKVAIYPEANLTLHKMPSYIQNQIMPRLELRKPFQKKKLDWSKAAKQLVIDTLGAGPKQFLEAHGKELNFWPRYQSFLKEA